MSINKFIKASIQEEDQGPPTPSPQAESFTDFDHAYHSMLCAGCSCLCDDISYYMRHGRVTRTLNLCELGWKRLCSVSAEDRVPPPSPSRQPQPHPLALWLALVACDRYHHTGVYRTTVLSLRCRDWL